MLSKGSVLGGELKTVVTLTKALVCPVDPQS